MCARSHLENPDGVRHAVAHDGAQEPDQHPPQLFIELRLRLGDARLEQIVRRKPRIVPRERRQHGRRRPREQRLYTL